MIRPSVINVKPNTDYTLILTFDNGEVKSFDVTPYLTGDWFSELKDINIFTQVKIAGLSIAWPNEQDICPDDLYYNSTTI